MINCELFEHPCSRVSVCLRVCVWRVWIRNVKCTHIYDPDSWIQLAASLSSQNTFADQRKTLKWRGVPSVYVSFSETGVASVRPIEGSISSFVPIKKAWPLCVCDKEGSVASGCPSEGWALCMSVHLIDSWPLCLAVFCERGVASDTSKVTLHFKRHSVIFRVSVRQTS